MALEIVSEKYLVLVNPEEGGRVEKLTYSREGRDFDIFKPRPLGNREQDGVPLYGSFVMLPFCNRLFPPVILTSEGPITIPKNWTEESCSIHGLGLSERWKPEKVTNNTCIISTHLKPIGGKCIGIGIQKFEVSDHKGVLSRLGYYNNQFDWILAGLGFHPWFNLTEGDAHLKFEAEGKFETDKNIPTSYKKLDKREVSLSADHNNGIDSCFGRWDGRAELTLENLDLKVEMLSNSNNLHVYINRDLNAICIEPVNHVTNAMHDQRWNGFAGMKKVYKGETIWLDMSIQVVG